MDNPRTIVALDLSATDTPLLQAIQILARPLGIQMLYALHIMPDFTLPEKADVAFQQKFAPDQPIDEKVGEQLDQLIRRQLGKATHLEWQVDVIEGKPYEKLLHWIQVKDAQLLVLGNKEKSEGSGITARRVARKADTNLIFVPDQPLDQLERILVPIDFSEHSERAVRAAMAIKARQPACHIDLMYVIDIPPAEYYVGAARDSGLRGLLKDAAHEAYLRFMEEADLDQRAVHMHFLENAYSNIAAHINEFGQQHQSQMIILGAQGHSGLESFLFGSVTEKVVDTNKKQVILVVR